MNKNPLIPTATVDKNGRQTTVHRRMDTNKIGASGVGIPMVSMPPTGNAQLIVTFGFEADVSSFNMSDKVREKMMDTLHRDTITRMQNNLAEHNVENSKFRKATCWCAQNRNFAVLNSLALLTEESEDKSSAKQERNLLALMGVQHIRKAKTPEIDLTSADDPRVEGARALVKAIVERGLIEDLVTVVQPKKGQDTLVFLDEELGNLIMDRPDRADEIVDMYAARTPFDRGLYEARLDNNVKGLNDGVL